MPAISTTTNRAQKDEKPKRKPRVVKPKAKVKVRVTVPDAQEATRSRGVATRTPDQADRERTPRQKTHDAAVVKTTIASAKKRGAVNKKLAKSGARVEASGKVHIVDVDKFKAASMKMETEAWAPVLRVLHETTRINHAIAGAADAAVTHKSIPQAALKGVKNETDTTFSDVLGHAGVKNKKVKSIGGFALDVATDPTTYATFGLKSAAAKSAESAAKGAEKTALKKGLSPEQSKKMGDRARTQTEKKGDPTTGLTVKFAGKEVPGVRKATAKASKPVRAVARKATPAKVKAHARAVASDLNPDVTPVGVSKETSRKAVQATRTARARVNRGTHEAQQGALGIKRTVGPDNYSRIIDAIENGTIGKLEPELRDAAVRVRSQFRHANRQRKRAGIRGGEVGGKKARGNVKEYIPHDLVPEAAEKLGHADARGIGRKVIRPTSSMARADERKAPLSTLREKFPGQYSEDLPNLYASRKAQAATSVARADLNRRIADLGRDVKKGKDITIEAGESVYQIVGSDIRRVTDKKELARLADQGGKSGRYVVLNDDLVKRAVEGSTPSLQGPGIVKGLDKVQGGFKRIALATPGFHVRNMVGDTQNAYLGQAGHRLPGNMVQAGRVLKADARRDSALRGLTEPVAGKGKVKTGLYGEVTYEQVAENLAKHGGMRSGYTARELPELSGGEKATLRRVRLPGKVKRALLNREDLPRVTTALDALKKGATWEEAAQRVADYHFDYAHLTSFERNVARRAMPFYCVPVDHEILTRHGFKLHHEVSVGDDVLALDHETGELEWTPLLEVAEFEFDGMLKTIKRRGADFAFTDDHRWPVVTERSFVKGKWYGDKRLIKRTNELNRSDRIPLSGEFRGTDSSLTPRQASILGWLVGDGYFRWRGEHCEMLVYQSPKKHLSEITSLLGHPGRNPHPQTGVVPVPVQREDRSALVAAGFRTKDDLLGLVGGLSRDAAEAMWDAMFKAEGWTVPGTGQQGFAQVAGPVLEAFQMLCLMTGRSCNIGPERAVKSDWQRQGTHQAYVRSNTHIQVGKLGEVPYTGTIWCPRTAHGTWVMRHNGTVILTGNTFTARNIPIQFKILATHPGKFANYQKLIESASKATGMDEESQKYRAQVAQLEAAGKKLPKGWQAQLSEWEQRNAGVPINWRGMKFTVSFGIPLTQGLNEVPGAAGKQQADEYFKTAMSLVTPIVKNPTEYFNNYSFFFRDQIENDNSPLVSAPNYVGRLSEGTRKDLHIVRGLDKRTGKIVWRWPGKLDYIVKTVPGLPQYAQQLQTEGTNRRGKGTGGKVLQLFGVRAEPFDPQRTITNLAYERIAEITKEQAGLRQSVNPKNNLPVSAKNPTPKYIELSRQLKIAQSITFQGQQAQGYKVLPTQGGPPRTHIVQPGRVKIPGVGGRVTVPGAGSRVKVP